MIEINVLVEADEDLKRYEQSLEREQAAEQRKNRNRLLRYLFMGIAFFLCALLLIVGGIFGGMVFYLRPELVIATPLLGCIVGFCCCCGTILYCKRAFPCESKEAPIEMIQDSGVSEITLFSDTPQQARGYGTTPTTPSNYQSQENNTSLDAYSSYGELGEDPFTTPIPQQTPNKKIVSVSEPEIRRLLFLESHSGQDDRSKNLTAGDKPSAEEKTGNKKKY